MAIRRSPLLLTGADRLRYRWRRPLGGLRVLRRLIRAAQFVRMVPHKTINGCVHGPSLLLSAVLSKIAFGCDQVGELQASLVALRAHCHSI